jgi:hypothetical protein
MAGRDDSPSKNGYKQDDPNSIRQHLIDPYNADVFIDTWNPHSEQGIDYLIKEFNPKLINVEHLQDSAIVARMMENIPTRALDYTGRVRTETSIRKLFLMWHKIHGCNQLRKRYEEQAGIKYDRVIRFRFELRLDSFPIIVPELNTCYIPQGGDFGGVNDMIAIGDSDTMDKYCSAFKMLREYDRDNKPIHCESLVKYHLEQQQVNVVRFPILGYLRGERWWR